MDASLKLPASPPGGAVSEPISTLLNSKVSQQDKLAEEESKSPLRQQHIIEMRELLHKSLYYEAMEKFEEYLKLPEISTIEKMDFIHKIILPLNDQINLMRCCFLIQSVVEEADPGISLIFLSFADYITQSSVEARAICLSLKGMHTARCGSYKQAESMLDEVEEILENDPDIELRIKSLYHRARATSHLLSGQHDGFCENALLHIAYTPMSSITAASRMQFAFDLAKASLIAENFYNFGELVRLPIILEDLKESANGWIVGVLTAFDNGDVALYRQLVDAHAREFMSAGLNFYSEQLMQKVERNALIQLAFKSSRGCTLSFEKIASHCEVSISSVELLLMKCMSLGLLSAVIDGVGKTAKVTWIMPRILSKSSMETLRLQTKMWCNKATKLLKEITEETEDMLIN